MSRLYSEIEQDRIVPEFGEEAESVGQGVPSNISLDVSKGIPEAVMAGETPVVAVHPVKSVRTDFLGRLVPALRRDGVRPITISSPDGDEIALTTLMDEVVGRVCDDPTERLELCHIALTTLGRGETRVALIVDDAHLLADQSMRYLDLMLSVSRTSEALLQIILLGSPAIWNHLPPTGGISASHVAYRMLIDDETGGAGEAGVAGAEADPGHADRAAEAEPALVLSDEPPKDAVSAELVVDAEDAATAEPAAVSNIAADPVADAEEGRRAEEAPVAEPAVAADRLTGAIVAEPEADAEDREHAPDDAAAAEPDRDRLLKVAAMVRAASREPAPPSRAKSGWFAVAACTGLFVVTGGFAVDLSMDGPISSGGLAPSMTLAQVRHWLGVAGVNGAAGAVQPAAVAGAVKPDMSAVADGAGGVTQQAEAAVQVPGETARGDAGAGVSVEATPAVPASVVATPPPATAEMTPAVGAAAAVAPAATSSDAADIPAGAAAAPSAGTEPVVAATAPATAESAASTPATTPSTGGAVAVQPAPESAAAAPAATPIAAAPAAPPAPEGDRTASVGAATAQPAAEPSAQAASSTPSADASTARSVSPPVVVAAPAEAGPAPGPAAAPAASVAAAPPRSAPAGSATAPVAVAMVPVAPKGAAPAPGSGTQSQISPEVVAVLIARGDALLSTGDVTAARLMYGRAAGSASAEGAVAMGMTFDPKVLSQYGVQGLQADPRQAAAWYQRAADLGSAEGLRLLRQVQDGGAK